MNDRHHQLLVRQRFAAIARGEITDDKTVVDVCPGGGKSRNVRIAVDELHKHQQAGGLIWLVPRASLATQSRRSFNAVGDQFRVGTIGLQLRKQWGYVATYQKFCSLRADLYAKGVAERLKGRPGIVLLVLDELHHCSSDLEQAWSKGVTKLRKSLQKHGIHLHIMNMTGTLFRGDGQPILHVDYENGKAITHIRYGLMEGRGEGAVIPPELVYVDGPVVIRQASGNESAYETMAEVPYTHRTKVRRAFLSGAIGNKAGGIQAKDSRQFTALYLLRYGMDHFIQQRREWNYPLQTIVVASSSANAMGYTSWLRRNYPELRIGLSLSNEYASTWAAKGFKGVNFPEMVLVDFDGAEHDVSQMVTVNDSSETSSSFVDDFQLYLHGMPPANYRNHINQKLRPQMTQSEETDYDSMPVSERVIHAFQADPIDGENVIDVLVTVGKAYEGLDAPRTKHLICLTDRRSAPWLAQCFARAWRRDYNLQAQGITDQRCWIFAPRDREMVDAVERIVWDQDLAPLTSPPVPEVDELEETELGAEDVLAEDFHETYDAFIQELMQLDADAKAELEEARTDEVVFPEPEDSDPSDDPTSAESELGEEGEGDTTSEEDAPIKPKKIVRAFNVVDRVIHEFVCDQSRQLLVLKDERITPSDMLADT